MSNNRTNASKTSTASLTAAPKNGKVKKTSEAKVHGLVIQDRIMQVLAKHMDGLSLEQMEAEAQKLRKLPEGRYAGVARAEFQTKKDSARAEVGIAGGTPDCKGCNRAFDHCECKPINAKFGETV